MNFVLSLFKRLYLKFAPKAVLDPDDINHWKEKILYTFIFVSLFLIFIIGATNFPALIKHNYWVIFSTIIAAYLCCLIMFFFPEISYKARAVMVSFFVYAVGVAIIYSVGPFLSPREWLLFFSIIASILLGWPGAIVSIITIAITFIGIGILITIGFWESSLLIHKPLFFWFQNGSDLFFINICTTLFVTFVFQKLEKSDREAKAASKLLLKQQGKLIDAKNKLEEEFKGHQQTDNALQESEKKYKHLFDNAPAGMYEIDFLENRFINVNQATCRYSGYSEEEFLSLNPLDILTEESKEKVIKRLKKHPVGERISENVEYNIIKKDGKITPVILNHDFIYRNEKLKGASVVVHDISEIKKAEREKTKAQQIAGEQKKLALVGQIAGKMAHDFNNILGIIMGNTELSLLNCKDSDTKKTLKLIFEQTIRGKNLTKNLVAFAKSYEPKQEFFRINEKIDLVISLLKKDLEEIELIKEDKPGVPDLLADPGMIEHALVNLLQNSIHAVSMVKDPKIIVRSFRMDDYICFEIEDNGCGIPEEYLDIIYEPSFTLKGSNDATSSYKTDIKGTGYGMSNVKKYVDQHNGKILVESKIRSGTKFTISLPVIKKELTSKEKIEISEEIKHFEKYILLVEDESAISDVQYMVLTQEPCNHKVDTANNGQVAMDLFDRNKYDLISLDFVLPGKINGMDVYNHIREIDASIPIMFVSGNLEFLESIKELKQRDPNIDHLSKPCQNKTYVNGINNLLEKVLVA
jgi:PAS domain S-box-containing protein